jgi:hypothetical protein
VSLLDLNPRRKINCKAGYEFGRESRTKWNN